MVNSLKKNKISLGIIIQARTGSSRLPNKILLDFYENQSILEILINNLKLKFSTLPLILATSTNKCDEVFSKIATIHKINFFQGSENNVLQRFIDAGQKYKLTHVIRICSDNPFLNMDSIYNLILNLTDFDIDYLSYSNHLEIPVIKTHVGLFAEIVSLRALLKANGLQNELFYQEHVTNFIYSHPQYFNIKLLNSPTSVYLRDDIRLTLDDKDDFENLSELFKLTFNIKEDLDSLINFIDKNEIHKIKMINNIKKYSK